MTSIHATTVGANCSQESHATSEIKARTELTTGHSIACRAAA